MTTNIEPTEEQKQAAYNISDKHGWRAVCSVTDLARLLAEREHKLTKERDEAVERLASYRGPIGHIRYMHDSDVTRLRADLDAARARIAELEQTHASETGINALWARVIEKREAAHLAHIKALRRDLSEARHAVEASLPNGDMTVDDREVFADDIALLESIDETLSAGAHYDVEGGEG